MREKIVAQGLNPDDFPILKQNAKPDIYPDIAWIWEGFTTLTSSRQFGMSGPQPLSLTEMLAYLDFRGITDVDDREEFIHLCQFVDRRFIADSMAKNKPQSSQPGTKPPGVPMR